MVYIPRMRIGCEDGPLSTFSGCKELCDQGVVEVRPVDVHCL